MIDHTGIVVNDFEKSKQWYKTALAPINYIKLMEFSKEVTKTVDVAGFGDRNTLKPDFWISLATKDRPASLAQHIAFRAENRHQVDQFYEAAIKAGGVDNGKPGLRSHYHENYYGAFVFDLDGNNIEAVCHNPE